MDAALNWTREMAKAIGSAVVENLKDRFHPYNRTNDKSGEYQQLDDRLRKTAQEGGAVVGEKLHDAAVEVGEAYATGVVLGGVAKGGDKLLELLRPGGNLIGEAGSSAAVRIVRGGEDAGRALFEELRSGGRVIENPRYPGTLIELPGGGTVGFRPVSKSGPQPSM